MIRASSRLPHWVLGLGSLVACSHAPAPSAAPTPASLPAPSAATAQPSATPFVLHIVGTSDVHGHLESLPILGGFVSALRHADGADRVVLVDAGDMFQGTLESALAEGAGVVRGFEALGYDAVAIGNHEFDFGPAGPLATPRAPTDDPRGALRERAKQAHFPFLAANLRDAKTGAIPAYENVLPSVIVEKHGVHVGIIGMTTMDTPRTTIAANFAGLDVLPLAPTLIRESEALRKRGADVVVLTAHVGGNCKNLSSPENDGQCDDSEEMMRLLRALPPHTIDAAVGGHTHQGMATTVNGIPIVQSFANGKAFGRIDLTIDVSAPQKVLRAHVFPTQKLELPASYAGETVTPLASVAATFAEDVERAKARKEQRVGPQITTRITRSHHHESAEGNLFADLIRAARSHTDVAILNGGGLRADLPEGALTYGALFEAMPFDNRMAVLSMSGAELRHVLERNASADHGILSVAGVAIEGACKAGKLTLSMVRVSPRGERGRVIADGDTLEVVTSDFVASGGDAAGIPHDRARIEELMLRDVLEAGLAKLTSVAPRDAFDSSHPRWKLPAERPVRCPKE